MRTSPIAVTHRKTSACPVLFPLSRVRTATGDDRAGRSTRTELALTLGTNPAATLASSQMRRDDARYDSSRVSVHADVGYITLHILIHNKVVNDVAESELALVWPLTEALTDPLQ